MRLFKSITLLESSHRPIMLIVDTVPLLQIIVAPSALHVVLLVWAPNRYYEVIARDLIIHLAPWPFNTIAIEKVLGLGLANNRELPQNSSYTVLQSHHPI